MKIARSLSSLSKNFVFPTSWEKRKGTPGVPFAPEGRSLLPHFAFGKTGRTGAPQCAA